MNKFIAFLILVLPVVSSCKDDGSSSENNAPTNLTLTADILQDNSGTVNFTSTATNANVFTFSLGNGESIVSTTGLLTYVYTTSGVYTVSVTAKSATGETASKSMVVTVTVVQNVVWSDEFDTPGAPNPAKWGYDIGAGGWGNNEVQYYTNRRDNSVVENGMLKIILKKESYSGSAYTSARLLSKGKYSFKYGKIEVRAKLPAGGGTWPAIWMLGDNISSVGWPACGEIDIMEHVGNQLNKIFGTLHHPGHSGGNPDGGNVMVSNVTTEFHKYTCEWSSTTIRFYVDEVPFYTFSNSAGLPFNQNFFIILNIAMGGNFGGTVDPAFTTGTMEIDYVRVYQ